MDKNQELKNILENLKSADGDILFGNIGYYSFIKNKINKAYNEIIEWENSVRLTKKDIQKIFNHHGFDADIIATDIVMEQKVKRLNGYSY